MKRVHTKKKEIYLPYMIKYSFFMVKYNLLNYQCYCDCQDQSYKKRPLVEEHETHLKFFSQKVKRRKGSKKKRENFRRSFHL